MRALDRSAVAFALLCALASACEEPPGSSSDAGASTDAGAPPGRADAGPSDAGLVIATEPRLPAVTGTCPDFSASGRITLQPAGIPERDVMLWISEAAQTLDGPVIFYWHGAGSRPEEATYGLGQDTIDAVLALGGMVIAPYRDPASGTFPWYLTTGTQTDDLLVADEALACAIEQVGVDTQRIHAAGMSAGGLHTSQMAIRRASYLASVVVYSGGLIVERRPPTDEPNNRLAVLMFHGGPEDIVAINFKDASERFWRVLTERGYFAAICDHGRGHTIPTDARGSVWRFLQDHPYGAYPSPYVDALPADFYPACALAPATN